MGVLFNEELGADAKHVFMLEKAGDKFKTNLTLKIPEEKIDECLKGEYRMYCKNIEQNNSFSYGLIIDSVTETGCEPNGFGTEKKSFTFTGKPRLDGKYVLENGDWIAEHGHAGAQEFLTHLFFAWPTISGGRSSEELKKYGHSIKTWPLSMVEAKAAIMSGDKY